jgi:tRNA threonylcarbamoyladenosine modification (KEOPS) complex Cgi121 subunit
MAAPVSIDTHIRLASMRQIHVAIEHLHRGDYECAIILAGAAEGILPDTWKPHFRQKAKAFAKSPEIQAEGGATGENDFINRLKHGSRDRDDPSRRESRNRLSGDHQIQCRVR